MLPGALRGRHHRLQEQLSAYLDDELLPTERIEIERHLDECATCRGDLEELRTVGWAIGQLRETRTPRSFALDPALFAPAVPASGAFGARAATRGRSVLYVAAPGLPPALAALSSRAGRRRGELLTRIGDAFVPPQGPSRAATYPRRHRCRRPRPLPRLPQRFRARARPQRPQPPHLRQQRHRHRREPRSPQTRRQRPRRQPPRPRALPPPNVLGGNDQPGGSVVISVPPASRGCAGKRHERADPNRYAADRGGRSSGHACEPRSDSGYADGGAARRDCWSPTGAAGGRGGFQRSQAVSIDEYSARPDRSNHRGVRSRRRLSRTRPGCIGSGSQRRRRLRAIHPGTAIICGRSPGSRQRRERLGTTD